MAIKNRLFAGFGAALFLVTSSALTIAVILTLTQNNNSTSTTINTSASKKASSSTSCPSAYNQSVGSKLQGYTPQTSSVSHLAVSDLQKGSGTTVKSGATVTACYIGALAKTGVIFDTSDVHGGAQTFSLSQVIPGWQVGIPGMKVGGTRELLIPASMAYGSQGNGSIPPNSDLVFLVSIVSTK